MSHYLQQLLINQGDQERIVRRRSLSKTKKEMWDHTNSKVYNAPWFGAQEDVYWTAF